MFVAVDVHYEAKAKVGALAFEDWQASEAMQHWVTLVTQVEDYEPGSFYLRELPCLLAALHSPDAPQITSMTAVIIDGYVWLDDEKRPGLGAHLYEALDEKVPVIGVAKNEFAGNTAAVEVLRGQSQRALFVTAAGFDPIEAARHIEAMHGPFRIPTLLQRVDALSRG